MRKLFILILLVGGLYQGWKHFAPTGVSLDGREISASELSALAVGVKANEVVMYSTSECPYCAQAKNWLNQNGFAFTECNMSEAHRCEDEFRSYGGIGTPYLVVRGHHVKDGFDPDEFLTALRAG
ncbi:MAG: glutaredoxin-like protein [Rhodocyclales bacterium]|nr:glutaredoxin-like protein [Rhodocyclales bacterium]